MSYFLNLGPIFTHSWTLSLRTVFTKRLSEAILWATGVFWKLPWTPRYGVLKVELLGKMSVPNCCYPDLINTMQVPVSLVLSNCHRQRQWQFGFTKSAEMRVTMIDSCHFLADYIKLWSICKQRHKANNGLSGFEIGSLNSVCRKLSAYSNKHIWILQCYHCLQLHSCCFEDIKLPHLQLRKDVK